MPYGQGGVMNVEMKAEVVIKWKTATGVAVKAPST